jgi:hypothetical protein
MDAGRRPPVFNVPIGRSQFRPIEQRVVAFERDIRKRRPELVAIPIKSNSGG